eukprot:Rhum_TRINITY_DN11585_c0_g1::Rhum_TRINITY_DN11585_c0_g1_i1::g.45546::m.45546
MARSLRRPLAASFACCAVLLFVLSHTSFSADDTGVTVAGGNVNANANAHGKASPFTTSSSSSSPLPSPLPAAPKSGGGGSVRTAGRTLVTGGNRGIGRGVVEELCARGHAVLATVRTADKAAALSADLRASHPTCDVAAAVLRLDSAAALRDDWAALEAAAGGAVAPRLALLNAAVNPPEPWDADAHTAFVDVNYRAVELLLQRLLTQQQANASSGAAPPLPPRHVLVVLSNYAQLKKVKDKGLRQRLHAAAAVSDVDALAADYLQRVRSGGKVKGAQPYAFSKNLAAALVRVRARQLAGGGTLLNGVHPGSVRTEMNKGGKDTPRAAAQHIVTTLTTATASGVLFHHGKELGW